MTESRIDPEQVNAAFISSLFKDDEVVDGCVPGNAVLVEGIRHKVGFHPARLEKCRDQVVNWLSLLPKTFMVNGGGGMSFLNACYQEDGQQWTGLHQRMDQLFSLGQGLGLVKCLLPREMWEVLPGSMPYYAVDLNKEAFRDQLHQGDPT